MRATRRVSKLFQPAGNADTQVPLRSITNGCYIECILRYCKILPRFKSDLKPTQNSHPSPSLHPFAFPAATVLVRSWAPLHLITLNVQRETFRRTAGKTVNANAVLTACMLRSLMKSCTLVRVTLGLLRKLSPPFHAILASDMIHQDLVMAQYTTLKISSATRLEGHILTAV